MFSSCWHTNGVRLAISYSLYWRSIVYWVHIPLNCDKPDNNSFSLNLPDLIEGHFSGQKCPSMPFFIPVLVRFSHQFKLLVWSDPSNLVYLEEDQGSEEGWFFPAKVKIQTSFSPFIRDFNNLTWSDPRRFIDFSRAGWRQRDWDSSVLVEWDPFALLQYLP